MRFMYLFWVKYLLKGKIGFSESNHFSIKFVSLQPDNQFKF